MAKITETEALILAALSLHGDSYGHLLWKQVGDMRGSSPKIVTLYKALHGLEAKDLVEGSWEDQEEEDFGRPRRRIYRITSSGRMALTEFAGTQAKVAQIFRGWAGTESAP